MTTIILTMVGILLAAVSALMVLWYGGDTFMSGSQVADANTAVNGIRQITNAIELRHAQEGMPTLADGYGTPDALVGSGYLSEIPASPSKNPGYAKPMVVSRIGNNNEVGYELLFSGARARYVQFQLGKGYLPLCDAIARKYMSRAKAPGLRGDGIETDPVGCGWGGDPQDPYTMVWARI